MKEDWYINSIKITKENAHHCKEIMNAIQKRVAHASKMEMIAYQLDRADGEIEYEYVDITTKEGQTATKLYLSASRHDKGCAKELYLKYWTHIKEEAEKELEKVNTKRKMCLWSDPKHKKHQQLQNFTNSIAEIKKIPIEKIWSAKPHHTTQQRATFACPLHNEKTPSFVVYKETNSWYCFGACGKGGDVIDLYKQLHNTTTKEAIQTLKGLLGCS